MEKRRVFRDWGVLVIAPDYTQKRFEEFLHPMGFRRVVSTDQDKQALGRIKRDKPNLVLTARKIDVFSGVQLLVAARSDPETQEVPFVIVGHKEDLAPGGLAEKVAGEGMAVLVPEPLDQEKLSQAISGLVQGLIDSDEEDALALVDEAAAKTEAEDFQAAAELYRRALDIYDRQADTWAGLGLCLTKLGEYAEAEKAYLQALERDGLSLKAHFGLAEVHELQGHYPQAIETLNRALEAAETLKAQGSSRARINFYVGEFELRLKRLKEADNSFTEAVRLDPENVDLKSDIGDAYADKGYYAESEKYYQGALEQEPDRAHALNRLGMAYRRQGKYEQALRLYEQAKKYHPDDENLLFNIARTLREDGQAEKAMETLAQALQMAPDHKQAKVFLAALESQDQVEAELRAKKLAEDETRDRGTFGRFDRPAPNREEPDQ